MPNSDTWPGGVAMESLSNMDSAGSCDSVISVNSGFSDDSMEHLSAEERACLMYLEETIESLEMQEDSGLSNDEPDSAISALKFGDSGKVQMPLLCGGIHAVHLDGGAIVPSKAPAGPPEVSAEPGSQELNNEHKTEQHASDQTSEPQLNSAAKPKESEAYLTQLRPPVTDSATACITPTPDTQTDILSVSSNGDPQSVLTDTKLCPVQSSQPSSELDLGLIPPPSDFRDEPEKEQDKVSPPPAGTPSKKPVTSIDLEQLRQRASERRPPVTSLITHDLPNEPPSEPSVSSPISPPPDASEPRSPPAVLPKPKKLPANIILKSHKTGGCDATSGHSAPSSADRLLLDPQRVRMEALRKLGLLKSEEGESGPALSPRLSPKSRLSWAAPATPLSPPAPPTPTPPLTPPYPLVSSAPPTSAPVSPPAPVTVPSSVSSTPPTVPHSNILPAPAAFSDLVTPRSSHNDLSAPKDVSEDTISVVSPADLDNQLTPPKAAGVQSHSLEHSGLGQESIEMREEVDTKNSLMQLRNSRPRPASLGSGREFSSAQGEESQASGTNGKDPESRRSLSHYTASHHSDNSQKLPRSQGISVLICPRAQNEEDRRVALRKLGLLRD